jgi:sugar phosphate isomerase/epimerase
MKGISELSRREFLQRAPVAAALATAIRPSIVHAAPSSRWKVIAFSKPFTRLNYDETADLVADVGWDGIECPVRKTATHIDPERVEEQLPKMAEALKTRGREVSMITTDITGVNAGAERILRTAAALGIRKYRLGPLYYVPGRPIPEQLDEFTARIRDLAQLNHQLGIQGGVQNHSGSNYFGAPVWDAFQAVHSLTPADMGIAFDIGHATLEGGLSWPIQAHLAEPRYSVVYVKDFRWERQAKGWEPVWCALGEGMVSRKFFEMLARSEFAGPICQHHEYEIGTTPAEHLRHFKEDLKTLRGWLAAAGVNVATG